MNKITHNKRVLIKEQKSAAQPLQGLVCSINGKFYFVRILKPESKSINMVECQLSGSMEIRHPHRTLVAVGDKVEIVLDNSNKKAKGRIIRVFERSSFLLRKSVLGDFEDIIATNFDQVAVIMSCTSPTLDFKLLDTLLVAVDYCNSMPLICINKIDICKLDELKNYFKHYSKLGYKTFYTSAINGIGIDELQEHLKGKFTLFAGISGVGKSSIINKIIGLEILQVGTLTKYKRGRHTTTSAKIIFYDDSTLLLDSPGFSEFQLWGIDKTELQFYFPDFEPFLQKCKFQPCTHTHEPNCAIKKAVKKGKINYSRYKSYLALFASLK
ncbi:MAG: ribosome small subunit-dependent GTPase A [Candidatus Kapaibacteriales bacterium]